MIEWRCGKCGYREKTVRTLQYEKRSCPTCGQKLHVQVRALVDADEARALNFKYEGGKLERLPDDV